MEEDIMILEEWLIQLNELFEKTKINNTKERKSLENLIKGYRKSEMENQSYKDYLGEPPCYDNAKYIPKSKIKEKIEELDNMIKEINKRKTSKVHSRRDYSF